MSQELDAYFDKALKWRAAMTALRNIVLDCGLTETLKWRAPCYTFETVNVVMIAAFKDYCALSFFKGVLLKDSHALLRQPGNHTQSARLIHFVDVQEIVQLEAVLKSYVSEAIEIAQKGLKVTFQPLAAYVVPEEWQTKLAETPALKTAFEALTPGRQKAYLLHFAAPKQTATRILRIESCVQRIFEGKGLNDCVCGLSQKMPYCDGSHKYIRQL